MKAVPGPSTVTRTRHGNIEKSQITTPAANSGGLPPTVSNMTIYALKQARGANVSTYQVCYLTPISHGAGAAWIEL